MWILLVIAATVLQAGPVRVVRHGDERLEGITRVDIVVNQAGDARSCGVVKDGLQSSAAAALADTRILASVSAKASSWFYSVQVSTASVLVDGRCATSVSAELVAQVDGMPEADRYAPPGTWGSLLVGQLLLVQRSGVVSSSIADHPEGVRRALHDQVTAIGSRIKAANP